MFYEEILIPCDLYGRNATTFNKNITGLKGNIWIDYLDKECNAKSLLGVLSMGIKKNSKIKLKTDNSEYKNVFNEVKNVLLNLI